MNDPTVAAVQILKMQKRKVSGFTFLSEYTEYLLHRSYSWLQVSSFCMPWMLTYNMSYTFSLVKYLSFVSLFNQHRASYTANIPTITWTESATVIFTVLNGNEFSQCECLLPHVVTWMVIFLNCSSYFSCSEQSAVWPLEETGDSTLMSEWNAAMVKVSYACVCPSYQKSGRSVSFVLNKKCYFVFLLFYSFYFVVPAFPIRGQ